MQALREWESAVCLRSLVRSERVRPRSSKQPALSHRLGVLSFPQVRDVSNPAERTNAHATLEGWCLVVATHRPPTLAMCAEVQCVSWTGLHLQSHLVWECAAPAGGRCATWLDRPSEPQPPTSRRSMGAWCMIGVTQRFVRPTSGGGLAHGSRCQDSRFHGGAPEPRRAEGGPVAMQPRHRSSCCC